MYIVEKASTGEVIEIFSDYNEMKTFVDAMIAIEGRRFYIHHNATKH
jgi:hypothetical protein